MINTLIEMVQMYKQVPVPIKRSLQDRLDDIVNANPFGATGDGTTTIHCPLQRAIDELFIMEKNRKMLTTIKKELH